MGLHAARIIKLTEKDWELAQSKLTAFSDNTLTIAKAVLVEGKAPPEVAKQRGVKNQTVHTAVNRVLAKLDTQSVSTPAHAAKDLQLSEAEWQAVQPSLRGFSKQSLNHAKRILVEGATAADVAEDAGVQRQTVYTAVARVKARIAPKEAAGLTPQVVWLPSNQLNELATFADKKGWKLGGA